MGNTVRAASVFALHYRGLPDFIVIRPRLLHIGLSGLKRFHVVVLSQKAPPILIAYALKGQEVIAEGKIGSPKATKRNPWTKKGHPIGGAHRKEPSRHSPVAPP